LVLDTAIDDTTMHGISNVKLISAQQAREINNNKNTKEKLIRTNAVIWKKTVVHPPEDND
jgi:hypothetical protein